MVICPTVANTRHNGELIQGSPERGTARPSRMTNSADGKSRFGASRREAVGRARGGPGPRHELVETRGGPQIDELLGEQNGSFLSTSCTRTARLSKPEVIVCTSVLGTAMAL